MASDPCTLTRLRTPESPASSSIQAKPYATADAPAQPYPCRCMPRRPSCPNRLARSRVGECPSSNHCPMCGRTCSSTARRTRSRMEISSSLNSESRASSPKADVRLVMTTDARGAGRRSAVIQSSHHVDPSVDAGPLLQSGPQRAVHPVLEVEPALPLHDMGEQVAVEGGVVGEQPVQTQLLLRGDQLVQPHRPRRNRRPFPGREPVIGIRLTVLNLLEDHD